MPGSARRLVPLWMPSGGRLVTVAADRAYRVKQRPHQVFLRPERPGYRPSRIADARRVGAEEHRRGGDLIARCRTTRIGPQPLAL
jgi:hypothetical protein